MLSSTSKRSNARTALAEFSTRSDRESHYNMKHAEKIGCFKVNSKSVVRFGLPLKLLPSALLKNNNLEAPVFVS